MFQLANHFDFVTYTLAAGSASRLATISKSREAVEDAARYHKLAMEGMTQAMQSLTRDNADAILGAALGCSYTLTDQYVTCLEPCIQRHQRANTWSTAAAH
jgi:hypothetical protein